MSPDNDSAAVGEERALGIPRKVSGKRTLQAAHQTIPRYR